MVRAMNKRGFSLIEVLIVIGIFGMVMASLCYLFVHGWQVYSRGTTESSSFRNESDGMDLMARDVRQCIKLIAPVSATTLDPGLDLKHHAFIFSKPFYNDVTHAVDNHTIGYVLAVSPDGTYRLIRAEFNNPTNTSDQTKWTLYNGPKAIIKQVQSLIVTRIAYAGPTTTHGIKLSVTSPFGNGVPSLETVTQPESF